MTSDSNRRIVPRSELGFRLAGFTDGEGHFAITRQQRPNRTSFVYGCNFIIPLRRDDRAILECFQAETGVGSLYDVERANKWGRPQSRWVVQRKAECLVLVGLFDEYPLWSKKARDYAIWRQAVLYMHGPRPEGKEPLERWFNEIRAIREYDAGDLEVIEPEPSLSLFEVRS